MYPVDTGRKLNADKTFRILPRRLLNVLCMFNLRPISMGKDVATIFFCRGDTLENKDLVK